MGGEMITEQDIKQATMFIDGVDIYDVAGALVKDFKIGATVVENTAYQGVDSTNFNVLSTVRGMRPITVTLFYKDTTKRGLALKKTKIDNALGNGKVELYMPDGFYYTSYLTSAGEESVMGVEGQDVIAVCTYALNGIRHDELETVTVDSGTGFLCKSLIPKTDVKISITVPTAGASGDCVISDAAGIGSVTLTNVGANSVIVIDGINKRILKNGAPYTGTMSFIRFPKLVPGENTIRAYYGGTYRTRELTVEYYPTY
jgi:phage-related protein